MEFLKKPHKEPVGKIRALTWKFGPVSSPKFGSCEIICFIPGYAYRLIELIQKSFNDSQWLFSRGQWPLLSTPGPQMQDTVVGSSPCSPCLKIYLEGRCFYRWFERHILGIPGNSRASRGKNKGAISCLGFEGDAKSEACCRRAHCTHMRSSI